MPEDTPATIERRRLRSSHGILRRRLAEPRFSARSEHFVDLYIGGQKSWEEAADEAGISRKIAADMMRMPSVLQAMQRRAQQVQVGEATRNPALAATIRDRGFKPDATAAQQKVSLEAARFLAGERAPGTSINVLGGQNVIAGYVVRLRDPDSGDHVTIGPAGTQIEHDQP